MRAMHPSGDAAGAIMRQRVSGHAAVDDTLARETGDVSDTGDGGTVLADRREGCQGEHTSATWKEIYK